MESVETPKAEDLKLNGLVASQLLAYNAKVVPYVKNEVVENGNTVRTNVALSNVKTEITSQPTSSAASNHIPAVKKNKKKKKQTSEDLKDEIGWSEKDLCELFRRIETILPIEDKLAYKSRVDKMDWKVIAFDKYSGEDCKRTWCMVQKKLRRYRLLKEILMDAKEWITRPTKVPLPKVPKVEKVMKLEKPLKLEKPPKPERRPHKPEKSHKKRHSEMPRTPLSAYRYFYLDKRNKFIADNPGMDIHAIGKLIAQMYKQITVDEKMFYEKLAMESRRDYDLKLAEFYQKHPDMVPSDEPKLKPTSKPPVQASPRKPRTPFGLYYAEQLKTIENTTTTDRSSFKSNCKEKWKSLPDKEKIVWIDLALEEERKNQELQMKDNVVQDPSMPSTSSNISKHVLTKEEQLVRERMAGKPTKPPCSAYNIFTRMMLCSDEIKCIHPRNRLGVISDQWKALSEEDKQLYRDRSNIMNEQYKKDLAAYLDSLPEDKRQEEIRHLKANSLRLVRRRKLEAERRRKNGKSKLKRRLDNPSENDPNKAKRIRSSSKKRVFRAGIRTSMRHKSTGNQDDVKSEQKEEEDVKVKPETESDSCQENKNNQENKNCQENKKENKSKTKKEPVEEDEQEQEQEEPESELMARFKGQPKKPPANEYALFCRVYKGTMKKKDAWKRLSYDRRHGYELQLQIMKREYIAEYAAFLKSLTKDELQEFAKLNLQRKE